MGKKGKEKFELKQLKINTLILNEKQVLREMVQGKRPVPDYYYAQLLVIKLYHFFKEEGIVDIAEELEITLTRLQCELHGNALENMVNDLQKNESSTKLMDLKEPIKIYKNEIETIKQLNDLSVQKVAFSILLLTKIQNTKHNDMKNVTYYIPTAYFQYGGITSGNPNKRATILHELYEAGIVHIGVTNLGFYCPIVETEGEVVYEIQDGFESAKPHFDKVFNTDANKIILEIYCNVDDYKIHNGYDEINDNRKLEGKKTLRKKCVQECTQFQRLSNDGSYFVEIPLEVRQNEEKLKLVIDKVRQIAKTYRKQTKTVGTEAIYKEFQEFIKSLVVLDS